MTDLIKRLRACHPPVLEDAEMCDQAADALEAQQVVIDAARTIELEYVHPNMIDPYDDYQQGINHCAEIIQEAFAKLEKSDD